MNKIKILFGIILLSVSLFTGGCDSDKPENLPEKLELSATSLRFASLAAKDTVTLNATRDWEITGIPAWLKIAPVKGKAGVHRVEFSVDENTTEGELKVRLVIACGTQKQNFPVYQLEKGVLDFKQKVYTVIGPRKSLVVPYMSNVQPEIQIPEDAKNWLSYVATKVVAEDKLEFHLEGEPAEFRSARVIIGNEANRLSDTLFIRQYPKPSVVMEKDSWFCIYKTTELPVVLDCNIPLEVKITQGDDDQWLTLEKNETKDGKTTLLFTMPENETKSMREASVTAVNEDCEINLKFSLKQMFKVTDGEVRCLQKATHKPALNPHIPVIPPFFVIMGDGFTMDEIESGEYDDYVERAYAALFSEAPYKYMKDHFSVYAMYCASNESGISDVPNGIKKDTKFNAAYTSASTNMTCDFPGPIDLVKAHFQDEFDEYASCIVLFVNGKRYAGTCIMTRDGRAVAICPVSTEPFPQNFEQLVKHEAGGHGYGKLADEYQYNLSPIPPDQVKDLKSWQSRGIYMNVVLSPEKVPWAGLIGLPDYPGTGIFEGGHYSGKGVWRSSEDGLMNFSNKGGYNAYSRFLIWKRSK